MLKTLFEHHPSLAIVLTIALVLVVGVAAQLLANRLRMPAILWLLGLGIALGPSGLNLVRPEVLGDGLRALVSIAVAVIVFEGALMIDVRQLRHCSRAVLGLITVGAGTTFLLAGALAHYVTGLPWKVAFLYGAIVSVTGPTVIAPLLKRVPLTHRLKTTIESESVFVDAVGVLLTAAVFSFITGSDAGLVGGFAELAGNLAIGLAVGGLSALGLKLFLGHLGTFPAELVRLVVLAQVLSTYTVAELLAHESGIAAVAIAGLITGSMRLPYEKSVKRFKGDLTLLALTLLFILLAARIPPGELFALGWPGLAVVVLLMAVVRPLAVWLATVGSGFSWRERAFIAWMGPRGIVAASLASLMTIELAAWNVQAASALGPMVFLTILMTVVIEGGGAGWMARWLNVMPKKMLIVGGDDIARRLAVQLQDEGEAVVLIDSSPDNVRLALENGLNATVGDAVDPRVLERAGIGWCQVLVAATPSDKANLMICQAARGRYPALRLVARVGDVHTAEAFREAGIEVLTLVDAAVMAMSALIKRPTMLTLMQAAVQGDTVIEVTLANTTLYARPLKAVDLPQACLVALLKRDGEVLIPDGETVLQGGDTLTVIGEREALDRAQVLLEAGSGA